MRKTCILLLVAFCFTAIAQNSSTSAPQSEINIIHVTVIDTETGKEATDQTVVISDGKISDVARSKNLATPTSARIVDGRGKYLIPGLWDMHVHTWDYESTYPLYIANGVIGIRDMFGPPDANRFRAELAKKQLIAPHFYLASPIVDGHPPVWPKSIEVTTSEQGRKVVDDQQQKGADFIKVYSRLTPDSYFAIAAESARVGIPFEGHVPNQVSAWKASDAKQKSFEHLYGIPIACSTREEELQAKMLRTATMKQRELLAAEGARSYSDSKCNDLFARLKANGNWQAPTLTVFSPKNWNDPQLAQDPRLRYFSGEYRDWLTAKNDSRFKAWTPEDFALERQQFDFDKKLTGAMFRAGVPLLAGTDTGNPYCFPGFSLHDELALLVESGLTPLAALQAATRNAALFMNAADRYGSVSKGKIADLVLLDADPLQDIHNTTKISEVFLGGTEFNRDALDGILRAAERNASASDQSPSNTPTDTTSTIQMQRVSRVLAGRWLGKITTDAGSHEAGTADETWHILPDGLTLIEENRLSGPKGDSYDYAAVWWNRKAQKYQGIWCAEINDEGCNGFDAQVESNRVTMTGEWEQNGNGHRRAWREVFSRPDRDSLIQTLDIGEVGGKLKGVSAIRATKIAEGGMDSSDISAEAELRAVMAELRKASIEGDSNTVASSMTDDYVQTDINGYRQDKTTWLNEYFRPLADLIKTGKFRWNEYERKNLEFRFYGDCAVVTGELQLKGTGAKPGPQHTWVTDPNASFSGTLHFTHVYIKRNGKWMLAALHNQMPPSATSTAN